MAIQHDLARLCSIKSFKPLLQIYTKERHLTICLLAGKGYQLHTSHLDLLKIEILRATSSKKRGGCA